MKMKMKTISNLLNFIIVNKKMGILNLLFVLIMGLTVLLSCNKEDNQLVNKDPVLVKKIINLDWIIYNQDSIEYTYNDKNQIIETNFFNSGNNSKLLFDYSNDVITSSNYPGDYSFKLNNDDYLSEFSLYENSFKLTYNKDGYLNNAKGHDRETSEREYTYEYKNGNLIKVVFDYSGTTINTFLDYTNITNLNNLNYIEDEMFVAPYFVGLIGNLNKNLVKRVIHENRDTLNYSYEFNADSLVTKLIINGKICSLIKY